MSGYMSVETITTISSALGLLLGFLGMFGWLIARIDRVEARLGARIDGGEAKLGARIDGVERELVEVKIGLARLEGPPHRLLPAR